ncbi:GntR family transcriptional regulator [Saccharopolyspora spinosa]|uniref:GntR family transcriptional regulator n=1 Tax=Saccharopolyspora spinosa TaxID=60894 RepID=A0A2N3Y6N6_SACSN|nr:GntR family transcriptional regulator [Saccharopolyspora spinosa]PKW18589.1 GntR family transcriptional regulator [Saccharopolyspora spinosa]
MKALAARLAPKFVQSTAERVANAVRSEVADGRLTPGMRLREPVLVDALRVSRNTLREALSQLITERLLIREPNRGVSVRVPDTEDVRDLYRARLVIEPASLLAGGQAIDRTGGDPTLRETLVHPLREAVTEGKNAVARGDWPGLSDANQHFHGAIAAMAGSARINEYMSLLLAEMRLVFHHVGSLREFHEPYVEQNAAIVRLAEAGEFRPAAEQLTSYLEKTMQHVLDAYSRL